MCECCKTCYEIDGEFYARKSTAVTVEWWLYDVPNQTESQVTDGPTLTALNAAAIPANERVCNLLGSGGECVVTTCYTVETYVPAAGPGTFDYAREDGGANQGQPISAQWPITPDVTGTSASTTNTDGFARQAVNYLYWVDSSPGNHRSELTTTITIPPVGELVSASSVAQNYELTASDTLQFRFRTWWNRFQITIDSEIGAGNNDNSWVYSDVYTPNDAIQELPLRIRSAETGGTDYFQGQVLINGTWQWLWNTWCSSVGSASFVTQTISVTVDSDGNRVYTLDGVTLDPVSDASTIANIESWIADGSAQTVDCDLVGTYSTSISKTASDDFPGVGDTVTYTVTATNTSAVPVMLRLTDVVQAPLVYVASSMMVTASDLTPLTSSDTTPASGDGLSVQTDTPLGAGESITMVYQAQKTALGDVVNTAKSETHYDDPAINGVKSIAYYTANNNTTPAPPAVDPSLSKIVTDTGSGKIGGTITYRVFADTEDGIDLLIDTLPTNTTFSSLTIADVATDTAFAGTYTTAVEPSTNVLTVTFDSSTPLPAGYYFEITVVRTDESPVINEASISVEGTSVTTTAYVAAPITSDTCYSMTLTGYTGAQDVLVHFVNGSATYYYVNDVWLDPGTPADAATISEIEALITGGAAPVSCVVTPPTITGSTQVVENCAAVNTPIDASALTNDWGLFPDRAINSETDNMRAGWLDGGRMWTSVLQSQTSSFNNPDGTTDPVNIANNVYNIPAALIDKDLSLYNKGDWVNTVLGTAKFRQQSTGNRQYISVMETANWYYVSTGGMFDVTSVAGNFTAPLVGNLIRFDKATMNIDPTFAANTSAGGGQAGAAHAAIAGGGQTHIYTANPVSATNNFAIYNDAGVQVGQVNMPVPPLTTMVSPSDMYYDPFGNRVYASVGIQAPFGNGGAIISWDASATGTVVADLLMSFRAGLADLSEFVVREDGTIFMGGRSVSPNRLWDGATQLAVSPGGQNLIKIHLTPSQTGIDLVLGDDSAAMRAQLATHFPTIATADWNITYHPEGLSVKGAGAVNVNTTEEGLIDVNKGNRYYIMTPDGEILRRHNVNGEFVSASFYYNQETGMYYSPTAYARDYYYEREAGDTNVPPLDSEIHYELNSTTTTGSGGVWTTDNGLLVEERGVTFVDESGTPCP